MAAWKEQCCPCSTRLKTPLEQQEILHVKHRFIALIIHYIYSKLYVRHYEIRPSLLFATTGWLNRPQWLAKWFQGKVFQEWIKFKLISKDSKACSIRRFVPTAFIREDRPKVTLFFALDLDTSFDPTIAVAVELMVLTSTTAHFDFWTLVWNCGCRLLQLFTLSTRRCRKEESGWESNVGKCPATVERWLLQRVKPRRKLHLTSFKNMVWHDDEDDKSKKKVR